MEGDEQRSPDPPVLPRRPRTIPRWIAILGALAIIAGIGGAGAWGLMSAQELERQTTALASARQELASKQTELAAVNGSLAAVRLTHDTATTRSESLKVRVADQSACIDAQTTARQAISGITELQIATFNLTTKESVWAKAQAAREKALGRAATNYFNAYKSAFFGNTSAAAASYRKGQADAATADGQRKIQDAELAKVSANNVKILAALDAFSATLATATSACATN
jgi:chromosome segregation ATPase